jgi:hypothetical protein
MVGYELYFKCIEFHIIRRFQKISGETKNRESQWTSYAKYDYGSSVKAVRLRAGHAGIHL